MADDQSRRYRLAAEAAIFQREDKALLDTLHALRSLYYLRRDTEEEQKFWNQFWHEWEWEMHVSAMRQAFADMARDSYFPSVSLGIDPNIFTFCNFERYVASDINKYIEIVETAWNLHHVDLSQPFSRLDGCIQYMGADWQLDPDDVARLQCGIRDHEGIRIALTQKYIPPAALPSDKDGNPECEGVSPDCDVASNDSMQGEREPANADDASEEVKAEEITPEEIERRRRNAEQLRIRVLERAAAREKKEAADKERKQRSEKRKLALMKRKFEAGDYDDLLALHVKNLFSDAGYFLDYKDQKREEYIELKAKVVKALKLAPPTQDDTQLSVRKQATLFTKEKPKQPTQPASGVEPLPNPAISEVTVQLAHEPESEVSEPKLPEPEEAEDKNSGSAGLGHMAQEPEEPEIKKTETPKYEDKLPQEKENKQPKQNLFVRAIKKLFGKTFSMHNE